ncbi:MAG: peroxynitrite isomerase [Ilumatobacteraceae bacterium]
MTGPDVTAPALHEAVTPLATLLGSWAGEGRGEYPTIEPFGYVEQITFGHVGKPFLAYGQRTRATDDGRPLHAETGYVRIPAPGRIEIVLAHPTGITEVEEGTFRHEDGGALVIELATSAIARTATAKDVAALERSFRIDGDELTYTIRMAAVGLPLQHHLSATLRRHAS